MLSDHSGRPSSSRTFGWIFVIVSLALLALVTLPHNAATRMYGWPWWVAQRVFVLLPLFGLSVVIWRRDPAELPRRLPRVWLVVLATVAGTYVVSALLSPHVAESLSSALLPAAAVAGIILLADRLGRDDTAWSRLAWIAAGLGVVFVFTSLGLWLVTGAIPTLQRYAELNAQLGAEVFRPHPDGFRNNQPLGHSNYTAGVALLVLPWIALASIRSRGLGRIGWGGGAVLAFVVLVSSGSRGALIGLAAGGAFLLIVAARAARWSGRRTVASAVVAVIVLAGLALAVPRVRDSLVARWRGNESSVGDRQRIAMTQIGLAMGREQWPLGVGPGLSTRLYPSYRHRVEGGVDMALQLHSTPVQVWAETGVAGVLAVAALAILALAAAMRTGGRRDVAGAGLQRGPVVAAGASFAAYAGFALTDYQFDLPVVAALSTLDLGVLLAAAGAGSVTAGVAAGAGRRERWIIGAAAAGLGGLGLFVSASEGRARQIFVGAVRALEAGGTIKPFNDAVVSAAAWQPDNPHVLAGGAAAHLRLGLTTSEPAHRLEHLSWARAFLAQSLAVEPDLEFAHTNLGWLLLESDPAAAARHFAAALHLLPDRAGGYFGLGLALLESGASERARDALALEIINDPAFLTSPAWDTAVLAPLREAVGQRATELAADFAAQPAPTSVATRRYVHHLLRWWTGDNDAVAGLMEWGTGSAAAFFAEGGGSPAASWDGMLSFETPGWLVLRAARADPEQRRALLARFILVRTRTAATPAELDGLEVMLDRLGEDWRGWLNAPEGRDAPFVKTHRRDRSAYTILSRNSDLPVALDAYLVQENRIASLFFDYVFPPRGWAPDALLLREVARIAP